MAKKREYEKELLFNLVFAVIFSSFIIFLFPIENYDRYFYIISMIIILMGFIIALTAIYKTNRSLMV